MATINLGAIKFNWKGAYNSSTSYAVDDVVSSGGNSYVCIQAHSNQAVGDATAYWNIMSAKGTNGTNGTNGTDLTSTLTTQGDILYRDGSGLQRLPKGTAGQVLQMNSGATAPEYGNVSSDFVKIGEVTGNNSSDTLSLNNIFSSTYENYKIVLYYKQTNKVKINWRYVNASGVLTGSSYYVSNLMVKSDINGAADYYDRTWAGTRITSEEHIQSSSNRPAIQVFDIFRPYDSTQNTFFHLSHIGFNDSKYIMCTAAGEYASATALTGISLQTSTGDNFKSPSSAIIYGMK